MKILVDTYKSTGNLHHAYILEGEKETLRQKLFDFIEHDLHQAIKGNPDVWHQTHDTFTIDDARDIREVQSNKALGTGKKIFIVELRSMTAEAQNSLLKVFEEPTPHTHFFIIMPSAEVLLPTLRSRVMIIPAEASTHEPHKEAEDFLKAPISARIKIAAEISEEKDKARAIKLVDGLIHKLHGEKMKPEVMQELLLSRGYLNDRSPSIKLLLEHIAIVL